MVASTERAYASMKKRTHLATSAAIHGVLFAALTAFVVEEKINPVKPLPMNVTVILTDVAGILSI